MNTRRSSIGNRTSTSGMDPSPVSPATLTNETSHRAATSDQSSMTTTTNSRNVTSPSTSAQTTHAERSTTTILNRRSGVWQYFERSSDVPPLKAKCLVCGDELSTPNFATSSLKRHLSQRHVLRQFGPTKVSRSTTASANMSRTDKAKIDMLALEAIIQDGRTFGDLQKLGIEKLINALQPGMIIIIFHYACIDDSHESEMLE